MKKRRLKKGQKGYLNQTKLYDILFIILVAIVAIGIYVLGMTIYKKTANIATVFAVLSTLPACKRIVNLLMLLQFSQIKEAEFKKIEAITLENANVYVDAVFSSETYLMKFDYLVINNNGLYAYSKMDKKKNAHALEYLSQGISKRQLSCNVKLCTSIGEYEHLLKSHSQASEFTNEGIKEFFETLMM